MKTPKAKSQKSRVKRAYKRTAEVKAISDLLEKKQAFTLTVEIAGETFVSHGQTLLETMQNFRPPHYGSKMVLTWTHDESKFQRYMLPMQARRIWGQPKMMEMFAFGIEPIFD